MSTGAGWAVTTVELDGGERAVSLARQAGVENVGINVFTFRPGEGSRIHRHGRQEEIYLVIRGTVTVTLDDGQAVLHECDVLRVAPEARRQLLNESSAPCVVLAIGAVGAHVRGDAEAFASWDDREPRSPADVPLPVANDGT